MSAQYVPTRNVFLVTVTGNGSGFSCEVPAWWTIQAVANHLRELEEWLR